MFRYGGLMLQGLTSKDAAECVQLLILTQLHRCVLDDDLVELVIRQNLVSPVIAKLQGDLVVAKEVTRWAVTLAESKPGLASLTSASTVGQLRGVSGLSSTHQMRVLDLVVRLAQISEDHLQVSPQSQTLCWSCHVQSEGRGEDGLPQRDIGHSRQL